MLDYVGPVIALLTGVIGIFYSKSGKREKLGRVGYFILTLVALAGMASIYGVYVAHREAAKEKDEANRQKEAARVEAARSAEQLRREKKTADTLRGILLARTFAETDSPANAIFYLDLIQPAELAASEGEGGKAGGFTLDPLVGPEVRRTQILFNVEDIVEIDYTLRPGQGRAVALDANYYEFGPKLCRLAAEPPYMAFTPVAGTPCRTPSGFLHNATLDALPGYRSFVIDLPKNQRFWKMFSRIEQSQRAGEPLGSVTIEAASPAAAARILDEARAVAATVKFFRPYEGGDCTTTLIVRLATDARIVERSKVAISLGGIEDFQLNFCEIVPI